ncbi:MAG TPA: DUF2905 domain-containing protein [Firmicutes bacterium]|nr:DUF2905 domain-containing protein [Candidatus Fermentithermobacillaceae bacterium]
MEPGDVGRLLMTVGVVIVIIGAVFYFGGRFIRLGRLPGDIHIRRGNFTFYFPVATCIILSLLLSAIMWLVRRR